MNRNTINKKLKYLIDGSVYVVKAWITIIAFSMNFAIVESDTAEQIFLRTESFIPKLSKVLLSFDDFSLQSIIFFCVIFKFYQFCSRNKEAKGIKTSCVIMAVFASLCLVIGEAFYVCGDIDILFMGLIQCIKSGIAMVGYVIFFYELFIFGLQQYDKYLRREEKETTSFFEKKYAFVVIVGILL